MRGIRAVLIAVIVLGLAGAAGAAGPRMLTRTGNLYTATVLDNEIVVGVRSSDGAATELVVPQSGGAVESSLQIGIDPASGALLVLWQRWTGMDARIRLATLVEGTWSGPVTIAGNDGTTALHPQMLIHRAVSSYMSQADAEAEPTLTEVATSFLHVAWWSRAHEDETGSAQYAAIPLNPDGVPQLSKMVQHALSGLLPYGALCFEIQNTDTLNHPKLFIDPQTNNPHIFLTDYADCAFHILELSPEVVEEGDEATGKRRRQIIILRQGTTIGIRADLSLSTARFDVGADLSIVAYWDRDPHTINYLQMNRKEISEMQTLTMDDTLSHEQAVDLIRGLIN